MIRGWDILSILMPGTSANSFDLPTNCYYCTAAALQNTTCDKLVKGSEEMQQDTGDIADFMKLFKGGLTHREHGDLGVIQSYLLAELPPHRAVAFGYNRVDGTGHMIVVFKAQTLIGSTGGVSAPPSGNLRNIDYQKANPQPADGMLPGNENPLAMTRYHIVYQA